MELASIEAPAGGGGREGREGVEGVEESVQDNKWEHPTGRMLAMAGLFDIWRTPKSVSIYSSIKTSVMLHTTWEFHVHR